MEVNNVNARFDSAPPPVAQYGKINSEQKKLIVEINKGSERPPEEIRAEYLAKEAEKLTLLPELSPEQIAARQERAAELINRHLEAPPPPPVPQTNANRVRRGLRRAEAANSGLGDIGQISKEQWSQINLYRRGELSAEEVKSQIFAKEEAKLNLLKIPDDQKEQRLARLDGVLDRVIK